MKRVAKEAYVVAKNNIKIFQIALQSGNVDGSETWVVRYERGEPGLRTKEIQDGSIGAIRLRKGGQAKERLRDGQVVLRQNRGQVLWWSE